VLLSAQTSRIITVATVNDGIKLPPSAPGLEIVIINHGANAMQVFGSGSDTVDDIAAATGVSQMAQSFVIYSCVTAGAWYTEGLANGYAGGLQTVSYQDSITAHAAGGQGSAVPLTKMLNRISVCATTGDSVVLPVSKAGMEITVVNSGAANANVFAASGENMNGSLNGSAAVTNAIPGIFFCITAGFWFSK
jgi:hypothetical protein